MNNYLTIEQLKQHLNIDTSFTADDDYLKALAEVAEEAVTEHCNNRFANGVPFPVRQAMLLMAGHLYTNREPIAIGVAANKIPLSYEYLLSPYINYSSTPTP